MPFQKGQQKLGGREKGVKNKEDQNSLRLLLQGCFHENRLLIRNTLNSLCTDVNEQVKALNAKVIESTDVNVIRAYVAIRQGLLEDFKWLMELKTKVEPKQVELTGRDGEELNLTPPQIIIMKHAPNQSPEVTIINRVKPKETTDANKC